MWPLRFALTLLVLLPLAGTVAADDPAPVPVDVSTASLTYIPTNVTPTTRVRFTVAMDNPSDEKVDVRARGFVDGEELRDVATAFTIDPHARATFTFYWAGPRVPGPHVVAAAVDVLGREDPDPANNRVEVGFTVVEGPAQPEPGAGATPAPAPDPGAAGSAARETVPRAVPAAGAAAWTALAAAVLLARRK